MEIIRMSFLYNLSPRVSMKWNNGHLWTAQFQKSEVEKNFEFKFVIKQDNQLVRWEEGHNHHYDLERYLSRLRQPEILREIESGKFDEVEVESEKEKIGYNRLTKVFFIHTLWQCN